MATILCVWELGGNLGHLSNLRLPVEIALQQGHRVVMALKELQHVKQVFGDLPIQYLQAPCRTANLPLEAAGIPSFTHLLIRQCFGSVDELSGYLRAWGEIFDGVKPDLVLFEHSPTALIAAHHRRFTKVLIGNGFTAPPVQSDASEPFLPFPTTLRSPQVWQGLQHDDQEVCKLLNAALARVALPEIPNLHAIYAQADTCFLMTWPVLDHFGPRANAQYLGVEPPRPHPAPPWPQGSGPLVFGYLQPFPSIELLLRGLMAQNARAVLFVRHLPEAVRKSYANTGLVFVDAPVDLQIVAQQADWVISHGNHSTAAHFMVSGVPQLLIPQHQEQLFLVQKLVAQGVAAMAFQDQTSYAVPLRAIGEPGYRQHARRLAQQCGPYDTPAVSDAIRQEFDLLLKGAL
ncbi:MAG: hypothetical protein H7Y28_05785 [Rhodoferax sp.]|nr:hypothetical protein [Rhodoferax sp.]